MTTRSQYTAARTPHIPVMLKEVLATLEPHDDGIYVDGTFGAGGYSRGILEAADCKVYAIDRDPGTKPRAEAFQQEFKGRFFFLEGCFGDVAELLKRSGVEKINGLVLDLGVSSMQIDNPERGFSFRAAGPLDMRMSSSGQSVREIVNTASEKELADIIFNYGEEHAARKIAKKIVNTRMTSPLTSTKDLARVVHEVLPMHGGMKIDTATKTFQAFRIYVNDELGELDRVLESAERVLLPEGRLVVVSFHSLEDSRVKNFLKERAGKAPQGSRHLPDQKSSIPATFSLKKNASIKPSEEEMEKNPRARSARLRYAVRTSVSHQENIHA